MKIGILSLQGDFAAHGTMIRRIGHSVVFVKQPQHLTTISGLILPGGESSTQIRLLQQANLVEPLRDFCLQKFPIFGTCAGLILLAEKVLPQEQFSLKALPIDVERNAYGSQKESFTEEVVGDTLGAKPFIGVFIRAPKIQSIRKGKILAHLQNSPVLVKHCNILGATFHPELTDDLRIHDIFISMCNKSRQFVSQ